MTDDKTTVTDEKKVEATATEESPKVDKKANNKKPDVRSSDSNSRPQRKRGRGRKEKPVKEFEEAVLQIDRVTRVNKGGRQLRFRISIIIGDKKGRVGFGIAKSAEVVTGIQKAVAKAKRNMITVPIFNDTIPHEVKSIFKASQVMIMPAAVGKGVIAGGAVRKILELAGVKNALSKVHGSRNKINIARATFQALQSLQNRAPIGSKAEESTKEEKVEKKEEAKPKKEAAKKPAKKKASTEKK